MAKDFYVKESQLDEYQMRLLMQNLDSSMVISGCAGSGKSIIALHKAKRIQTEKGNDYQIIVYTKALSKYMNDGRKHLDIENPFLYHWEWKDKQNCPSSDYIIVDEIQDFTKEEIAEFKKSTRKCFFFFGDTAQSIYDGLKNTQDIRNIAYEAELSEFPLYFNYRLPKSIAKITEDYIGLGTHYNEGSYKNPSTEIPRIIKYNSLNDQISAIERIIKRQSLTDVGILLPHNNDVKLVYNKLTSSGLDCECKYDNKKDFRTSIMSLNFETNNPKVMTFHSAKGLQFETVFIPNCNIDEDKFRKPLYVAMTRSSHSLYIMHNGDLSRFFTKKLTDSDLYADSEFDEIEDL